MRLTPRSSYIVRVSEGFRSCYPQEPGKASGTNGVVRPGPWGGGLCRNRGRASAGRRCRSARGRHRPSRQMPRDQIRIAGLEGDPMAGELHTQEAAHRLVEPDAQPGSDRVAPADSKARGVARVAGRVLELIHSQHHHIVLDEALGNGPRRDVGIRLECGDLQRKTCVVRAVLDERGEGGRAGMCSLKDLVRL